MLAVVSPMPHIWAMPAPAVKVDNPAMRHPGMIAVDRSGAGKTR